MAISEISVFCYFCISVCVCEFSDFMIRGVITIYDVIDMKRFTAFRLKKRTTLNAMCTSHKT